MNIHFLCGCFNFAVCGFILSAMVPLWSEFRQELKNGESVVITLLSLLFYTVLMWLNIMVGLNSLGIGV